MSFFEILSSNLPLFIFFSFLAFFVIVLIEFVLIIGLKKRLNLIFKGKETESFTAHIDNLIKLLKNYNENQQKILQEISLLKEKEKLSLKIMDVKRYNAFQGQGGNQSFALLVLNEKKDGFIVSGISVQDGSKVYSKIIKEGKSDILLSKEEEEILSKNI